MSCIACGLRIFCKAAHATFGIAVMNAYVEEVAQRMDGDPKFQAEIRHRVATFRAELLDAIRSPDEDDGRRKTAATFGDMLAQDITAATGKI